MIKFYKRQEKQNFQAIFKIETIKQYKNQHSSMNKQKKLKLILSSFKQKEMVKFFETFLEAIKCKFYKSIKQISFSCYESTCQVENYMVNGYGKTSSQALISGINNIIDCLIEEEQYCQVMRQCLKKFNVSPYGLTNNGTTSKKQLLSTQKTVKTLGADTSMSVQKKVLTMSANLTSNSKNQSFKAKSIKDEIFQYFNLENLKVKNPNQAFNSIVTPLGANNKIPKKIENIEVVSLCKSKQKYCQNEAGPHSGLKTTEKHLEQIYKRIKKVKDNISQAQKENIQLKSEIEQKKKVQINSKETPKQQYFTRPSFEGKQQKKMAPPGLNTQSNKKLSYLQMSLNDKPFVKDSRQSYKIQKHEATNQNHFQKVEIASSFKSGKSNNNTIQNLAKPGACEQYGTSKPSQQRKCLVDISNIKTEGQEPQVQLKTSSFATFNGQTNKAQDLKQSAHGFQTANFDQNKERFNVNPILYSKASQQQESLSIIESSKKLRSFSVQNSLNQKIGSYGTTKNPILNSTNLNTSFDHGSVAGAVLNIPQKKINIPKLNLQILPNYHGRSNKSLNQSLMQNYEKKGHMINQYNQ